MKNTRKPEQTAQDAVQRVLAHIERQPKIVGEGEYGDLLAVPEVPIGALAGLGTLNRLDDPANAKAMPSLLLEDRRGQAQIELCPFGPLALITSDGEMDTDPVAQALLDAGIWPLFQNDLDGAGPWHGTPLAQWLFPRRLSDALALFDGLRRA